MTGTASAAIFVLGPSGIDVARRIKSALPDAEILGLDGRVSDADRTFLQLAPALAECLAVGRPIIGVCAAGILIRALAPVLSQKRDEPPVLAVSDDGAFVVPLLGGLTGGNELARTLALALGGAAAITAAGSRRFGVQLESPPPGYVLVNPERAKSFTSDLLAGKSVRLVGEAPWLADSGIPFSDEGELAIRVDPRLGEPGGHELLYRPNSVVLRLEGDHPLLGPWPESWTGSQPLLERGPIGTILTDGGFHPHALAALVLPEGVDPPGGLVDLANIHSAELRFGQGDGVDYRKLADGTELHVGSSPIVTERLGRCLGQLTVVGIGPGDPGHLTADARAALAAATDLVGYDTYLDLAPKGPPGQRRHPSGNRVEIERAQFALDLAREGRQVAVVSSGDPGVFAMAAAVMEAYEAERERWPGIRISVVPGISAMQTLASKIGAPLGADFCAISLSDIRKPWSVIEDRLIAAAESGLVIALYNPASKDRRDQIARAKAILEKYRDGEVPVAIGRKLTRNGEATEITTLAALDPATIDMRTVLIIGNEQTRVFRGPGGRPMVYSPRTVE